MKLKRKNAAGLGQLGTNTAGANMNINPDHAQTFDDLTKDVLGDDASDSDSDNDKNKNKYRHDDDEEEQDEETEKPYMFFDFRKGIKEWPRNAVRKYIPIHVNNKIFIYF